jgi:hypothetical protein
MTTKRKQLILAWYGLIHPEEVDGIWGKHSKAATKKLQGALGIEQDGDFGPTTAAEVWNAIFEGRELVFADVTDINVGNKSDKGTNVPTKTGTFWDEIEFFDRDEFRCKCGGKYCNGFPAEPNEHLVRIADQLRQNLGVPITIISGLRCETWNRIQGGVENSQHKYGEAADIYAKGVSQSSVEAELDKIGGVRYHYAIKDSSNVHFDVPKGNR